MSVMQGSFAGVQAIRYCEVCGRPLSNPTSVAAGIGPICRGKHGVRAADGKQKQVSDPNALNVGEKFVYTGFHGCDCFCYIRRNGNVVLCTEAHDNPGTSITNMAEGVATQVCRALDIPLDKLVWIEHYAGMSSEPRETFDLVTFEIVNDAPGGRFAHPKWKSSSLETAMRLLNG